MEQSAKKGVQQVVNEIYIEKGEVKPSELLRRAKPVKSPAHCGFEWDNDKAGQEYRLWQARRWIRVITVTVEEREEKLIHVPVFINADINRTDESAEGFYKPISVISQNQDEYERAIVSTIARLQAAKSAYEDLKNAYQRSVSAKQEPKRRPNFKKADKGFQMVEKGLMA